MTRLIVCERASRWTVGFRWALESVAEDDRQRLRVIEARNLSDCWSSLEQAPGSIVAIEAEVTEVDGLASAAVDLRRWFPRSLMLLLGGAFVGQPLWSLRELGVLHVTPTLRDLSTAVQVALRHLQRLPEAQVGIKSQVWRRLPWQ